LTVWVSVRFSLGSVMEKLRWITLLALIVAASASAGPKGKKGGGKPAPAAAAPAERKAPNVNVNRPVEQAAAQESAPAGAPPPTRGPTRIDFDDRLIQGQTNKSGAVYLYDRKELKTKSMIKTRDSFRDEIVGSLYDT
jgi:hypothetical protein